jgi:hypothetical protein
MSLKWFSPWQPSIANEAGNCCKHHLSLLVLKLSGERNFKKGGFKFQVQRVNDGAVAHRLPGA